MQPFFNRTNLKDRRRELRNNATVAEREMWCGLRKRRTHGYKFRRQHSIGPYIADFYSPDLHLVVEIDGDTHANEDQQLYDAKRTAFFREHGIDEIRFSNIEVLSGVDACMERIVEYIEKRGTGLTTP